MTRARALPDRSPWRRFVLQWGWAVLAVVLLSAAPSQAEPRSRPVGSAFDPASMAVALQPKASDKAPALRAAPRDVPPMGFSGDPVRAVLLAPVRSASLSVARRAARWEGIEPAWVSRPPLDRAHGARAPPAA